MDKPFRLDMIPSNWILIWFILFYFKIIKYNPKLALLLAIIFNTIQIFVMVYFKISFITIFILLLFVSFTKLIPLWLLRKTKYEMKQVLYVFVFLMLYTGWLYINGETLYSFCSKAYNETQNNRSFGPVIPFIDKFFKDYQNK
jgi:hypothetical protein